MNLKPATPKAWALLRKLQALAEKGIDGEKTSAQGKIARLRARYDFKTPESVQAPDLFSGAFKPSAKAARICSFRPDELELASAVKWAIEAATKIRCLHRGEDLLAQASPATARRLGGIANHISAAFRLLLGRFQAAPGVSASDRTVFIMGLYDGMMNEVRAAGQRLPAPRARTRKSKRAPAGEGSRLNVHPYTLAVGLGRQIRFSAPAAQIAAELEQAIRGHIAEAETARP
jgi:hypothetical protein